MIARKRAQARVNRTLHTPYNEVLLAYDVEVLRSGEEVLESGSLMLAEVVEWPCLLLSGDPYAGGDTLSIDPFHPAFLALAELRLAAGLDLTRPADQGHFERTMVAAGMAIHRHGVPQEVGRVSAHADRAHHFEANDVLGILPEGWMLGPPTVATAMMRTTATVSLIGSLCRMPAEHPARAAVEEYVGFLATPGIPPFHLLPAEANVRSLLGGEQVCPHDLI